MPDFNPTNAKLIRQLTFEGAWPSAVAFICNDKLAAANLDGQLLVWDLNAEPCELSAEQKQSSARQDRQADVRPLCRLEGHTNGITRLISANGGATLVSAGLDRSIRVWDPAAAAQGESEIVLDVELRRILAERDKAHEHEILAAPGVKVPTIPPAQVIADHRDWIFGLGLSANGQRLVSGDDAGMVIVWDFTTRTPIRRWSGHRMCGVVSAAISPDATRCFVAEFRMRRGDFDRPPAQAKIYSLEDAKVLLDLIVLQFPDVKVRDNSYGYGVAWQPWVGNGFVASAFSPDGKLLALGQGGEIETGRVHLIEVESGKVSRTVSGHQNGVTDVKFSSDGKHLFSTGRDTTVRICRVEDGTEVATLGSPRGGQSKDWLTAVDISPDQTKVAATDIAGLVHVWEMR
jgi:WD40 repeat protein